MINKRVSDLLSLRYERRLLIYDTDSFINAFDYPAMLAESNFKVIYYDDIEAFRLLYEKELKDSAQNQAVIVTSSIYVPYDIQLDFFVARLSLGAVFPKLNEMALKKHISDLDIISLIYDEETFCDKLTEEQSEIFITEKVFSTLSVENYCGRASTILRDFIGSNNVNWSEWLRLAIKKARLEVYAAQVRLTLDLSFIDAAFEQFVLSDYQKLSGQTSSTAPTILPKVVDFIAKDKAALIVMDGMSLFDFSILSRYFDGIEYELQCSYALIPSTTAISRQSLLSGKYPRQLENPFSLSNEEKGFLDAATERGYSKQQVAYSRGYDVQPGPFTKLFAIIINDIDDIVHGQQQGRPGMFNDITLLAKTGRLQTLICSLHKAGFTVYLTADHGNTLCRGIGSLRNVGVEVETKAKRMLILKDFADISKFVIENTVEYPAYYLDKNYRYLICKAGVSFDNKNNEVMTHGGISIDEVLVPFVKIKAVK